MIKLAVRFGFASLLLFGAAVCADAAFNLTWSTAYNQTSSTTNQLRAVSVADQPGNDSVYVGFIQTTGANNRRVNRFDTTSPYTLLNQKLSASSEQPKGIATDDRGNVFVAYRNSSVVQSYIQSFSSTLSAGGAVTPNVGATVGGLAIQKSGANYYAYAVFEASGIIQRYNVTNPGTMSLDNTWAGAGVYNIPGSVAGTDLRGVEIGSDGTIFTVSRDTGRLYKISSDLSSVSSLTLTKPMDLAIFGGNLFVTSYAGAASVINVVNAATMTLVDTITISTLDGNPYSRGALQGWGGIDIDASGRIWLGDQSWGTSDTTNAKDRLLVSSAVAAVPEPAMIAVVALCMVAAPFAVRSAKKLAA
jgi:hypothetical protein